MDRLISEQAVIESIEFFQTNPQHFDFVNLIDDIKEIPSAEPRWIPVSDRLPKRENSEQLRGWYLTTNAYGSVGVTKYEFENGSFGFIGWESDIRIVAWMPLPQAYKAEREGE